MLKKLLILVCLLFIPISLTSFAYELTDQELEYIEIHKNDPLTLGLDPYSGMDYFMFRGKEKGYIIDVVKIIEKETGLEIDIIGDQSWGEVYNGLIDGNVDILFGANATEERKKFMSFTKAIHQYPYAIFTNDFLDIQTIGDLDQKNIGFIEGDMIIDAFSENYSNLDFNTVTFTSQEEALEALNGNKRIQGFITSGGGIVYEFLYTYKDIRLLTQLPDITSDMTLSTLKENRTLSELMNKILSDEKIRQSIEEAINETEIQYNRKILGLSPSEIHWLENQEPIVVGVATDYLPFDYYTNGEYEGVAGKVFQRLAEITGIKYKIISGSFDEMYEKSLRGEVDVLNMAKTIDRQVLFDFPKSFSKERDGIYGNSSQNPITSLYELEGKRVAVIKGFWHEELLKKNLINPKIIKTDDIMSSLALVASGEADFFIENNTVAEYYINELDYKNLSKKGVLSENSFLYFGINKDKKALTSIFDKSIDLINYEKLRAEGLASAPDLVSPREERMRLLIIFLCLIVLIIGYFLYKIFIELIDKKAQTKLLKEKEKLLYLDPLTQLRNRNYLNHIEKSLDDMPYPQGFIISDLNDLKETNDQYGHLIGDALIVKYSEILKKTFVGWTIFRTGGDEFLLFKAAVSQKEIEELIKQNRQVSDQAVIEIEDGKITGISAAIGYTIREKTEETINQMIKEADEAMYADKKAIDNGGRYEISRNNA